MFSSSDAERRIDAYKLEGDLRDVYVELLSAQCAVDRIRMRYNPEDVAVRGNRFMVSRTISAALAICEYFSLVHKSLLPEVSPGDVEKDSSKEKRI